MRYIKLIFTFLVMLVGIGDLSSDNIKITTSFMGPFIENGEVHNMNVSLYNSRIDILPVTGTLKLKIRNDEVVEFTYFSSSQITLKKKESVAVNIPFPTDFFANGKCHCTIYFQAQIPYLTIVEFDVFSTSKKIIDIATLENRIYVNDKIGFQIVENEIFYKNEQYDFRGFLDELISDKYYRLELEQFYFVYESEKQFSYEKAFVTFEDPSNVFPLLEEDDGQKAIPLKVYTLNDNKIQILFDKLYVEENYLWMSSTYKDGLTISPYFYLPLNAQEKLFGLNLRLVITNAGEEQNDFYFDFEFYFGNNLFGDCQTSDFCLIGGVN